MSPNRLAMRGPPHTREARRLEALVEAGLVLASELSLPHVLRKIVTLACEVADARYGALGVLGADGKLADFITEGVSPQAHAAIGDLPVGRGLLGVLIHEAEPLRLRRIQDDPRSVGFPANHPPMVSFLGVPVSVRGTVYGNLYLTEKRGATEFTEDDERAVVTLATQAGVAIENARLFAEAQDRRALEERNRLARELHDSVSQSLFSMTLQTRAAQLSLEDDGPADAVAEHLQKLRELTEGALAEMRALIFELRPDAIREEGLVAAVCKQAESVAARDGLRVDLDVPNERLDLPAAVEEQLYRIAQESLGNIVKHSHAAKLSIRIIHTTVGLEMEVSDDGVGFEPKTARPGHLGMRTMAHRVSQIGGHLEIASAPGDGTVVRVTVPSSLLETAGDQDIGPSEEVRSA